MNYLSWVILSLSTSCPLINTSACEMRRFGRHNPPVSAGASTAAGVSVEDEVAAPGECSVMKVGIQQNGVILSLAISTDGLSQQQLQMGHCGGGSEKENRLTNAARGSNVYSSDFICI